METSSWIRLAVQGCFQDTDKPLGFRGRAKRFFEQFESSVPVGISLYSHAIHQCPGRGFKLTNNSVSSVRLPVFNDDTNGPTKIVVAQLFCTLLAVLEKLMPELNVDADRVWNLNQTGSSSAKHTISGSACMRRLTAARGTTESFDEASPACRVIGMFNSMAR